MAQYFDNFEESGDSIWLDKSLFSQPQIVQILGFQRMESFGEANVLHIAFSQNTGWTRCTKPMQQALQKIFPNLTPDQMINQQVMVLAEFKPATGNFSEGYRLVISAPPQQAAPPPGQPAAAAAPAQPAVPGAPAAPVQEDEIPF